MKAEKYKTLFVMVTGFLVLYWYFYHIREKSFGLYFLYISLAAGILSISIPAAGDWIVKGWYKLAEVLGWINTRILLSVIFFLLLTPIALVRRLFVKDPLRLKRTSSSLYEERNHRFTKEDLENPW